MIKQFLNITLILLIFGIPSHAQSNSSIVDSIFHIDELLKNQKEYINTLIENDHVFDPLLYQLIAEEYQELDNESTKLILYDLSKDLIGYLENVKPNAAIIDIAYGNLYSMIEEYKNSIFHFNKALLETNNITYLFDKAINKKYYGDYNGAINDFTEFRKKNESKNIESLRVFWDQYCILQLAECYLELENVDKCLILCAEYLKKDKTNSDIFLFKGVAHLLKNEDKLACVSFSKAAELNIQYFKLIDEYCK